MQELIREYVLPHLGTFISAIATGLAGFLFGRKKQNAEVEIIEVNNDSVEIANADKLVNAKDTGG